MADESELAPLLDYHSGDALIEPGTTFTATVTANPSCVPMRLRLPLEVAEHFHIEGIYADGQPLLAVAASDPLAAGQHELPQVLLERGTGFSIVAENRSEKPRGFAFKVWGRVPS